VQIFLFRIFIIFLWLWIGGCTEIKKKKSPLKRPFLMMNTGKQSLETTVDQLVRELKSEQDPSGFLEDRLQEIYSSSFRKILLFPLLGKLDERALRKTLISNYRDHHPKDIPTSFLDRMLQAKGDLFVDLLALYVRSGHQAGFSRIDQRLTLRRSVAPAEILLHCEILIRLGKIDRAAKKLPIDLASFPESHVNQARSLLGIIFFFQGRYSSCIDQVRDLFALDDYREAVVDYLVDSFLFLGNLTEAFRYSKIYATHEFENPRAHLLQSKIFLTSGNFREACKEWKRARAMGAHGERFHVQSFLLSHVSKNLVREKDMGPFLPGSAPQDLTHSSGLQVLRFQKYAQELKSLKKREPRTFSSSVRLPFMASAR
jgi:tetratricopeptide (TPR) repeat protein